MSTLTEGEYGCVKEVLKHFFIVHAIQGAATKHITHT